MGWAENTQASVAEEIHDTHDERVFRTYDSQVDAFSLGELGKLINIDCWNVDISADKACASVSRSEEDFSDARGLTKLPAERMFASAGADNEDFHIDKVLFGIVVVVRGYSTLPTHLLLYLVHMKINQFAFVCYPTKDMAKARAFYEGVLGLVPNGEYTSEQFTEYNIGDSALAIGNMDGFEPHAGGGCAVLEVEDFDAAVKELQGKGVVFSMGPMDTPVCHMALFHDPEGNSLMIHRRKAK